MENTTIWYKSKRFWGLVASSLGFLLAIFGQYFGQDFSQYIQMAGTILSAFGIPFTAYSSINATRPIGFAKKK